MSEVKREFWLIEYDSDTTQVWKDECPPEHEDEAVHVVSMDWHLQEMERMGAAYDGVSSRHRELMNDFNRVADSKSHLSSQVLEQQLKIDSLTAMLDKMEGVLKYAEKALVMFNADAPISLTKELYYLRVREALKELADFRGSK